MNIPRWITSKSNQGSKRKFWFKSPSLIDSLSPLIDAKRQLDCWSKSKSFAWSQTIWPIMFFLFYWQWQRWKLSAKKKEVEKCVDFPPVYLFRYTHYLGQCCHPRKSGFLSAWQSSGNDWKIHADDRHRQLQWVELKLDFYCFKAVIKNLIM
jgi:hypothetical protein